MPDAAIQQVQDLSEKVGKSSVPKDLQQIVLQRLDQLSKLTTSPTFLPEFDRMNRYIDWITALPWETRTKDILDLAHAEKTLNKNHYGLVEIKDRILEYIAVMKLKQEGGELTKGSEAEVFGEIMRAPILCFVGLVGTGKTTIASSIAEALGRKFARIPFGGMEDPLDLRGLSRLQPEAEPGKVIKALKGVECKNPVILLDEIDRVTDKGRASIMGVLVELLDPEQNNAFTDHYIDYPFDLSQVLFIATANNTHNIATAVLDRLEPINMPSYNDNEKITIGRDYMLPRLLNEMGMSADVINIQEEVWSSIVRPLGFDAGTRTLERTIRGVLRKVARMRVEGKEQSFTITSENVKEFLPK